MRNRLANLNLVSEGEVETEVNRLLNELHQLYRLRLTAPATPENERKEQAAFLQLRVIESLFPGSRHTHLRVKLGTTRWGKTANKSFRGIKVTYDRDDGGKE
jgi:hypothetical protein